MDTRDNLRSFGVPRSNVLDLRSSREPAKQALTRPGQRKPVKRTTRLSLPRLKLPSLWWTGWRPQPVVLSAVSFVIVALLVISPILAAPFVSELSNIRTEVLAASSEAYGALRLAGERAAAFEFEPAVQAFDESLAGFARAEASLDRLNGTLRKALRRIPVAGSPLRSGEGLLTAGREFAEAGRLLSLTAESLLAAKPVEGADQLTVALAIGPLSVNVDEVVRHVQTAISALGEVRTADLPAEVRETIRSVKERLPDLERTLSRAERVVRVVKGLFAAPDERQYLVVFQNNNELRATGGFMGSLALVSVRDGSVRVLEVPGRGFLDLDHAGMPKRVAPEPLWLVNTRWQAQDANWWPDFPTSAGAVRDFYRLSRGYDVDGVIAVTPRLVESLLGLTGPADVPEFGLTVDATSLQRILQEAVEETYDRSLNQPKQVIGALMPVLLDKLLSLPVDRLVEASGVLSEALESRDLLLNAADEGLQTEIADLGWAGQVLTAPSDYFMVVDTNVGGGKTDGVMSESIEHEVEIGRDGRLTASLRIRRDHHGNPDDPWTKTTNVVYLRISVPAGSELLDASGFSKIGPDRIMTPDPAAEPDPLVQALEGGLTVDTSTGMRVGRQFGKTVFANWIEVPVGEHREATVTYRLPFAFTERTNRYSLLVQAQPGTVNRRVRSVVRFPNSLEPTWLEPVSSSLYRLGSAVFFSADLSHDRSYGIVFEPAS